MALNETQGSLGLDGLDMSMAKYTLKVTGQIAITGNQTIEITGDTQVDINSQTLINLNATAQTGVIGGFISLTKQNVNLGSSAPANQVVLWNPGLLDELNRLQGDITRTADELKFHRHARSKYFVPFQFFPEPQQTIKQSFVGSKALGFLDPDTGAQVEGGTGPIDDQATGGGEFNSIDTLPPPELGGLFAGGTTPGNAASAVVNSE